MPTNLLQVMISSTTKDLGDHRAKAINAVLRMHMYPLGMEHSLASSSATPVDASLDLVDRADVYVGIFGHRYGYVPRGSEYSVTHLEYKRAVARGIPRLIFVADDAQRLSPPEEDHRGQLRRFREEVLEAQVAGLYSSADDLTAKLMHSLASLPAGRRDEAELPQFSSKLQERFAALNKTIDALTADQFQVIDMFRRYHRLAISGCAGSGKTLLAIEKALRLRDSHFQILLLCHNPHLAKFMAAMTAGTGIHACDFASWVRGINQSDAGVPDDWTHYDEPTQTELEDAFCYLADNPDGRYHAVIVDEGQDFDDDWWVVVEAALVDLQHSLLYIFYDDRQRLREAKLSKFPIPGPHPILPKNCRNSGEVFALVRRFHDQAPEGALALAHEGVIRKSIYRPGEEKALLQRAVIAALDVVAIDKLAVLTTELPPETTSIFNGFSFHRLFRRSWQSVVADDLQELKNRVYECPDAPVPVFGMNGVPEEADLERVREFARFVIRQGRLFAKTQEALKEAGDQWRSGMKWTLENDALRFKKNYAPRERLMYYLHGGWATHIPAPEVVAVSATAPGTGRNQVTLSTVSTFKGLEVDGAVLFLRTMRRDLRPYLYVGTSRPRYFLHVLLDHDTDTRYSAQFGCYEPYTFKDHAE